MTRLISFLFSLVLLLSRPLSIRALAIDQIPLGLENGDTETTNLTVTATPEPFYVIAHRVLVKQGIEDALSHGANALEIDVTAWDQGWWADHGLTTIRGTWGDTVEAMFQTIAEQRNAGKTITFVWLDIKNPDECDPAEPGKRACSIEALRDLARKYLQPVGVRVLYGFKYPTYKAYPRIRDNLNSNEAVNLNGMSKSINDEFSKNGPADKSQRVMSYGWWKLRQSFGTCQEKRWFTCTELRQASQSRAFGKVFGWTVAEGQVDQVDKLLGTANVDGVIYGFQATHYYDHWDTRSSAKMVIDWVRNHPDRRYVARQENNPW